MKTLRKVGFGLLLAAAGTACEAPPREVAPPRIEQLKAGLDAPRFSTQPVCPQTTVPGMARCFAQLVNYPAGDHPFVGGLTAQNIQSAYNIDITRGTNQVIAIVDAYDDPNAESDLNTYRSHFGLGACTTANGCFTKYNQTGQQTNYPTADAGWAVEISLDLQAASAACPLCKIILVEADSAFSSDLVAAVDKAVTLGANVVSNSYGGPEVDGDPFASHYNHAGVFITASTGDNGFGVSTPAAYPTVVAVGGTTLVSDTTVTRGWTETAWSGAGSGCSLFSRKPSWQSFNGLGCTHHSVADVSAVADPATGLVFFDSYMQSGWLQAGGTSLSSPLVAAIFAVSGRSSVDGSYLYAHPGAFNDVTSGSNGACAPSGLCNAVVGLDGPTGLGTPNSATLVSGGG